MLRGDQGPGKGPLSYRGFDEVSFYLPEGSRAGTYDVAIFHEEPTTPLVSGKGTATVESDKTTIRVTLDLSRIAPGDYWSEFAFLKPMELLSGGSEVSRRQVSAGR